MSTKGLLIRLRVVQGKEEEAEQFLKKMILPIGTIALFSVRFRRNHYGIFGAFNSTKNREFYLRSATMKEVEQQKGLLFSSRFVIRKLDILADKIPSYPLGQPDLKGLLLTFKARKGNEYKTENFLRKVKSLVEKEPETTSWFGISIDNGEYGIFDVFPDSEGRLKHLTGKVPKKLIKRSSSVLGSIPDMNLLSVVNESFIQQGMG